MPRYTRIADPTTGLDLIGQQAKSNSLPVTIASDQDSITVTPYPDRSSITKQYTVLGNTSETTILSAAGSGVYHDINTIVVVFEEDVQDGILIDIRDSTGGSIVMTISAQGIDADAAGTTIFNFPVTFPQTTANNNWTAQLRSSPGRDDVFITVIATKNT